MKILKKVHRNKELTTKKKGFVLLYTILIITLVLGVSGSVLQIMMKELRLANFGEVSQIALYAAKSGSDCALYTGILGKFDIPGSEFTCLGRNYRVGLGNTTNYEIDFFFNKGCAKVEVDHTTGDIRSRGYNTSCSSASGLTVERGILEHYK